MVTVTKLKRGSQSADNIYQINENRISETLRNKISLKKISIHVPTHRKPITDIEFGHYLAGLIDGDGHFSKTPQLVIVFNELDVSLGYYIKSKLGFGKIYKVKNKKAILLVVSKLEGIVKVLELINGKIKNKSKIDQINQNILINPYFNKFLHFNSNPVFDLNNYWLSGFTDADGSFQIKLIHRVKKAVSNTEVRLNFQIDQKIDYLLILIKDFIGGNIGYRKNKNTYYYGSTSFGSAKKVINYFDNYPLLSYKYLNYLKWRKAYIIIQNKEHLTTSGLEKLIKLKTSMNRNNKDNEI